MNVWRAKTGKPVGETRQGVLSPTQLIGACGDLWCVFTRTDTEREHQPGWEQLATWAPKLLLIAAAASSYGLNIAHAPATAAARTIAALPPTALVTTEVVLMVIVRRAAAYRALGLAAEQSQSGQPTPVKTGQARTRRDLHAQTRELADAWDASGRQVTGADLARELGTSTRHGRRLLAVHRAAVNASTNDPQPTEEVESR
jgi:hypothetical protein